MEECWAAVDRGERRAQNANGVTDGELTGDQQSNPWPQVGRELWRQRWATGGLYPQSQQRTRAPV
jgi:hypothetical protein